MVILISGQSGSGKTTVAKKLIELISQDKVSCLHQDSYYKDQGHLSIEERNNINFDHPDALELHLLAEHIRLLSSGQIIKQPQYDFVTHTRLDSYKKVKPKKLILVDGIHVLSVDYIRDISDLKVFVDTDNDICFIRRLLRDTKERGRSVDSVINQYIKTVKTMQEEFVAPSIKFADIIIKNGGENKLAIEKLKNLILEKINE